MNCVTDMCDKIGLLDVQMSLIIELNKNLLMKSVDFERGVCDPHKYNVSVFDEDTKKTQNVSTRITCLEWNLLPPRCKLTALTVKPHFCWDFYYFFSKLA